MFKQIHKVSGKWLYFPVSSTLGQFSCRMLVCLLHFITLSLHHCVQNLLRKTHTVPPTLSLRTMIFTWNQKVPPWQKHLIGFTNLQHLEALSLLCRTQPWKPQMYCLRYEVTVLRFGQISCFNGLHLKESFGHLNHSYLTCPRMTSVLEIEFSSTVSMCYFLVSGS